MALGATPTRLNRPPLPHQALGGAVGCPWHKRHSRDRGAIAPEQMGEPCALALGQLKVKLSHGLRIWITVPEQRRFAHPVVNQHGGAATMTIPRPAPARARPAKACR